MTITDQLEGAVFSIRRYAHYQPEPMLDGVLERMTLIQQFMDGWTVGLGVGLTDEWETLADRYLILPSNYYQERDAFTTRVGEFRLKNIEEHRARRETGLYDKERARLKPYWDCSRNLDKLLFLYRDNLPLDADLEACFQMMFDRYLTLPSAFYGERDALKRKLKARECAPRCIRY